MTARADWCLYDEVEDDARADREHDPPERDRPDRDEYDENPDPRLRPVCPGCGGQITVDTWSEWRHGVRWHAACLTP